jgi:hypothetical protein
MDDAMKDLYWVIGIIIVIFILWFFNGGKQRALDQITNVTVTSSNGYTYPNTSQNKNNSSFGYVPYAPFQPPPPFQSYTTFFQTNNSGTNESNNSNSYSQYPKYQSNLTADPNQSPYAGKISFSYRNLSWDINHPEQEYLTLIANSQNTSKIDITGWTLTSLSTGHTATLGGAVTLPFDLSNNTESDLTMRPDDQVQVITGLSPINYSFLVNKCSEYFQQYNTFSVNFGGNCPSIMDESFPSPPNALDDACYNYLPSVPSCRVITNFPSDISYQCQQFVTDHQSYNMCVQNHKSDSDFYSHTWLLYLKRTQSLWKSQRETIELRDQNDKLVDTLQY